MIYALLGDIRIGDNSWTGPVTASETRTAALVELDVARGKPPIQDMGDDNDTKSLSFFFDETFCDPQTELAKLEAAFASRRALAYVAGDGAFNGVRYLVKSLSPETLRSTPYGRPVRIAVSVELIEAGSGGFGGGIGGLGGLLASIAKAGALAITRGSGRGAVGSRK
jgi:phage protein U